MDRGLVEAILGDAKRIVRRLGLPANQHHLYDDIVQDTMIVALRNLTTLATYEPDRRRGWIFATMFLVTRNTQRAEIHRTAMWERLRNAFHHPAVRNYFDQDGDDRTDQLVQALNSLSELDRELIIGHAWSGYTVAELATQHHLTVKAVRQRIARARTNARKLFPEIPAKDGENQDRADM